MGEHELPRTCLVPVDLVEELGAQHRVASLRLIGLTWRNNGHKGGVDERTERTDFAGLAVGRSEDADEIVTESQLVLVADVKVLRPAVPLQMILINASALVLTRHQGRAHRFLLR